MIYLNLVIDLYKYKYRYFTLINQIDISYVNINKYYKSDGVYSSPLSTGSFHLNLVAMIRTRITVIAVAISVTDKSKLSQ